MPLLQKNLMYDCVICATKDVNSRIGKELAVHDEVLKSASPTQSNDQNETPKMSSNIQYGSGERDTSKQNEIVMTQILHDVNNDTRLSLSDEHNCKGFKDDGVNRFSYNRHNEETDATEQQKKNGSNLSRWNISGRNMPMAAHESSKRTYPVDFGNTSSDKQYFHGETLETVQGPQTNELSPTQKFQGDQSCKELNKSHDVSTELVSSSHQNASNTKDVAASTSTEEYNHHQHEYEQEKPPNCGEWPETYLRQKEDKTKYCTQGKRKESSYEMSRQDDFIRGGTSKKETSEIGSFDQINPIVSLNPKLGMRELENKHEELNKSHDVSTELVSSSHQNASNTKDVAASTSTEEYNHHQHEYEQEKPPNCGEWPETYLRQKEDKTKYCTQGKRKESSYEMSRQDDFIRGGTSKKETSEIGSFDQINPIVSLNPKLGMRELENKHENTGSPQVDENQLEQCYHGEENLNESSPSSEGKAPYWRSSASSQAHFNDALEGIGGTIHNQEDSTSAFMVKENLLKSPGGKYVSSNDAVNEVNNSSGSDSTIHIKSVSRGYSYKNQGDVSDIPFEIIYGPVTAFFVDESNTASKRLLHGWALLDHMARCRCNHPCIRQLDGTKEVCVNISCPFETPNTSSDSPGFSSDDSFEDDPEVMELQRRLFSLSTKSPQPAKNETSFYSEPKKYGDLDEVRQHYNTKIFATDAAIPSQVPESGPVLQKLKIENVDIESTEMECFNDTSINRKRYRTRCEDQGSTAQDLNSSHMISPRIINNDVMDYGSFDHEGYKSRAEFDFSLDENRIDISKCNKNGIHDAFHTDLNPSALLSDDENFDCASALSIDVSSSINTESMRSVTNETITVLVDQMEEAKNQLVSSMSENCDNAGNMDAQLDMAMLIERLANAAKAVSDLDESVRQNDQGKVSPAMERLTSYSRTPNPRNPKTINKAKVQGHHPVHSDLVSASIVPQQMQHLNCASSLSLAHASRDASPPFSSPKA